MTTAAVTVTDSTGAPLPGVNISFMGPVNREGRTSASGTVHFAGLRAGDYRVRFEHDGFITLERDVTIRTQPAEIEATLSPAPAQPAPEPPPPARVPPAETAPPGEPRAVRLVDYIEKNPVKEDELGCTASAKTLLLQLREDTPEEARKDADEVIYVVAGEGTLRLGNTDVPLKSSSLAIVPRGTVRAISRKGRNPLYLLSIVSGPACTKQQ
jgi:mannose-6-phosphate isomerase-like protein (cupin superfamily)